MIKFRTEIEDPIFMLEKTLNEDPNLPKLRILRELIMCMNPRTEIELPSLAAPLSDHELAKWRKSSTDNPALPGCADPSTLRFLSILMAL